MRAATSSIAVARVQPDKKGDFYVAVVDKPGRPAIEVIAGIVPEIVTALAWKSNAPAVTWTPSATDRGSR